MIRELLAEGRSEAEVKAVLQHSAGMDALEAQFAMDLELGRTQGDVLTVNRAGQTVSPAVPLIRPEPRP